MFVKDGGRNPVNAFERSQRRVTGSTTSCPLVVCEPSVKRPKVGVGRRRLNTQEPFNELARHGGEEKIK